MKNLTRLSDGTCHLCVYRTDEEAIQTYMEWMCQEEALMWIGANSQVLNFEAEKKWALSENENFIRFNIVDSRCDRLIGNCDITRLPNRTSGSLGILIGESEYRGKGWGSMAMYLLVKFAFEEMHIHRLCLNVNTANIRAIKCYQKLGFRICGTEHEVQWCKGKWMDSHNMELLEQDYYSNL